MLQHLLSPRTVAVIGASRKPGKAGHAAVANLLRGGFAGTIVPVNPHAKELLGLPCVPRIGAYEGGIDLCLVALPAARCPEAVEEAVQAGARCVAVVAAGFKETSEEGARWEARIVAACKPRGVRLLGPNCLGLLNTHHSMNASFASQMPARGGLSVISQSGALCSAILDLATSRRLGVSKLISIGNKADINEVDILRALAEDEDTRVIVGYLESVELGDEFVRVAEQASLRKPVILFKAGTTPAGIAASASHTGSFAGADVAYRAAFRRAGIIRAESFESLFDYASAFASQPLPRGDRVAVVTNAGGPGVMAVDALELAGLPLARLAPETIESLRRALPASAHLGELVDLLGDADPARYATALAAVLADPGVDAAIVLLTPQAMTRPAETAGALAAVASAEKPLFVSFMGGDDVAPGREALAAAGIPDYPSPERAVAALRALVRHAAWRERPPRVVTRFRVNRRRVARVLGRYSRAGRTHVGEVPAKRALKAYGFVVPEGEMATSPEGALEVAERLGYPVAMKVISPDVIHKAAVGGVRLGVDGPEAVLDSYDLITLRVERQLPGATVEGIYVERMIPEGREVVIGMHRDPQFGPVLMFGLGGVFVEVVKDVAFHLAPITAEEARQMLRATRSYRLLEEDTRGQVPVDLDGIVAGLQRVSQLVTDFPQIVELEIDPFIVGEVGRPPVVVDARIVLAPPREEP